MRDLLRTYRKLFGIYAREARWLVPFVVAAAVAVGLLRPLGVYINERIFDDGLLVAQGQLAFGDYVPYLVALVLVTVLGPIIESLGVFGLAEPRALMILNTSYKGEMLSKLKRMRYEHLENAETMEVIDKAFGRAVNSARHLFPMYITMALTGTVASIGILWMFAGVRWWLPLTIVVPFALETLWRKKYGMKIYEELEHYWNKERRYTTLAGFLKSRDYLYEGKLNASSDFLIDTYRERLHRRNKEYERFYFRHLKDNFAKGNVARVATVVNACLLLWLYTQGAMSVGTLVALTLALFGQVYQNLLYASFIYTASGYHIKFTDYYDRFFALSEDEEGVGAPPPERVSIEFRDVWFRYPGEDNPDILKGLSFSIEPGEKISIVGENGEGKSTMIKLLLGLFVPDRGEILLGGVPITRYTRAQRNRLLAPIFQDFTRYSIPLKENIAVGSIEQLGDMEAIRRAAAMGQVDKIAGGLRDGYDTLLGRDFEGGVDLSGGQWQRIAIARAFMGSRPVLILDEPTSQLDPMAESRLYAEFERMAQGRTAIFITHRLASTMITSRILVLHGGVVAEEGGHDALMARGGIYRTMFDAQRKWYAQEGGEGV